MIENVSWRNFRRLDRSKRAFNERERERERERKGGDKVREREVPGGKVFKIKVGLLAFGATAADRNKVDDQVEGVPNKMKFVPWWLW